MYGILLASDWRSIGEKELYGFCYGEAYFLTILTGGAQGTFRAVKIMCMIL